jgi:uncharacterized protein
MNGPVYFELQADDPARAVAFYTGIFGWEFEKQTGLTTDYWRVETGGIAGGLLPRPAPTPPQSGTNAAVISMEVKSYDQAAAKILAQGGIEALPKFAVPGRCWQGYFVDTEGNTFGIFEADKNAR